MPGRKMPSAAAPHRDVDRLDPIRPDLLSNWNPAPNPVSAGGWFSAPADALS